MTTAREAAPRWLGSRVWAVAAVAGLVTGFLAVSAMHHRHTGCDWVGGGEAEAGAWMCPDGIAYAIPTMAAAGAASLCVLLSAAFRRRLQARAR